MYASDAVMPLTLSATKGNGRMEYDTNDASSDTQHAKAGSRRGRNALVFAVIAVVWVGIDIVTKRFFNAFELGDVIAGPVLGLFRFRLVHNTGAAWGMFGDSTVALAILSLAVCLLLVVYLFVFSPRANFGQVVGLALVFGGGMGNALDRFSQGYVVDFIDLAFMNFPVFNVADIGVTCGFIIFLLGLIVEWRRMDAAHVPHSTVAEKSAPSNEEGADKGAKGSEDEDTGKYREARIQ